MRDKTQGTVRAIQDQIWSNTPGGPAHGNDDLNTSWATAATAAPPSYAGDTTAPASPRVGPLTSAVASSLCVDDASSGTSDGTHVQIWGCDDTYAQDWIIAGDGTIRALGKCLDADHSGTTNGTLIQLWTCNGKAAQNWRLPT
ncbi:ricin-type beta-trefoil lectin domain protein [Streptomyces sp. NPDC051105]|uniref:ricin-type beta-trefoil lectin domain protein n=1 Tax=Streptomyces sp. NPDC051105 TaxID=3154843 RepID=UPI00344916C9